MHTHAHKHLLCPIGGRYDFDRHVYIACTLPPFCKWYEPHRSTPAQMRRCTLEFSGRRHPQKHSRHSSGLALGTLGHLEMSWLRHHRECPGKGGGWGKGGVRRKVCSRCPWTPCGHLRTPEGMSCTHLDISSGHLRDKGRFSASGEDASSVRGLLGRLDIAKSFQHGCQQCRLGGFPGATNEASREPSPSPPPHLTTTTTTHTYHHHHHQQQQQQQPTHHRRPLASDRPTAGH